MLKKLSYYNKNIQAKFKKGFKRVTAFVDRRPIVTFFILLGCLVAFIALGNFIRRPKAEKKETAQPVRSVEVYRIGAAPKISLQAQVEKSGVVTITALSGGVVQAINADAGKHVNRGTVLFNLSTNYQGGNALSVQRQLAQTQYNNILDTYQTNKDLISKQRDLANKTDENNDRMREISAQSIDETQGLINLNDEILSALDANLNGLQNGSITPMPGTDKNSEILQIKELKAQLTGGNNQLKSALRNTQYSSNGDNPPAQISDLNKDILNKQLDLQEKALDLNKEVTRLQLVLAQVNEAMMYPSAPFSATIQRVLVKVGQAVTPSTPLAILSQDVEEDPIVAIAYAPREVAQKISNMEPSILHLGNFNYEAFPSYITQDAIQGTLYGIYFPLPDNYSSYVTEKGYIRVDLPIGFFDTSAAVPYVPIDVVYQTQDQASIFVVKNGRVESRNIKLGEVYGRYVQVQSGLKSGDVVILDRNVIAGDKIKVTN